MVNSIYPDACPKLLINNGNAIMLSTDEVGAVAKYECHKDFKLEGDSIRRCLGNHKWTGKEPQCHRQCECKSYKLFGMWDITRHTCYFSLTSKLSSMSV